MLALRTNNPIDSRTSIPGKHDYTKQDFGPPWHSPILLEGDSASDGVEDLVRDVRPPPVFAARRQAVLKNALHDDSPTNMQVPTYTLDDSS